MARLPLLALLLTACGQYTGPQPNAFSFWQVKTSTLEWGECSDAMDIRDTVAPIQLTDNTFIIYRVSDDGKTAVTQKCTTLDDRTCAPSDGGVVFDVVGRELTFTRTTKDPVGNTGCSLQQTELWTLTDATRAMTLDVTNTLTLVDSRPGCDSVEADLKARSPNMLGVEGCVITNKLTGELK
ncbi:MAG TPA: hypothetical protein VGE37_11075 [Archangium sp.]